MTYWKKAGRILQKHNDTQFDTSTKQILVSKCSIGACEHLRMVVPARLPGCYSDIVLKISGRNSYDIKDNLLYHPERICVIGIRSVATRQKGTEREQGFIVHVFKGLALLPKADRRPENLVPASSPSLSFFPFKSLKAPAGKTFLMAREALVSIDSVSLLVICLFWNEELALKWQVVILFFVTKEQLLEIWRLVIASIHSHSDKHQQRP